MRVGDTVVVLEVNGWPRATQEGFPGKRGTIVSVDTTRVGFVVARVLLDGHCDSYNFHQDELRVISVLEKIAEAIQ